MKKVTFFLFLFFSIHGFVNADPAKLFLVVTEDNTKIYRSAKESGSFIGIAQKGDRFRILKAKGSWFNISYKDFNGWISHTRGNLVDGKGKIVSDEDLSNTKTAVSDSQVLENALTSTPAKAEDTGFRPQKVALPSGEKEEKSKWGTSKQFPPHAPSVSGTLRTEPDKKFFVVTKAPARIISYLSPDSPILGLAKKGEVLDLVGIGESWCKVVYNDTLGWVERRNGEIVDKPKSVFMDEVRGVLLILGVAVLLIGGIAVLIIYRIKKSTPKVSVSKNVLIIAHATKTIQYSLTDTTTTLERCFSEIGFEIHMAKDIALARHNLEHAHPDVVLIDWQFSGNIQKNIEKLYTQLNSQMDALFIFYNVPDPSQVTPSTALPDVSYLGLTFSDRDLFKLVTPVISGTVRKKKIVPQKKAAQPKSSALEGKIEDGNLMEVIQFIEIGSKTGCLLIATSAGPFGIIYFMDGRIVYSAAENAQGKDAVFSILSLKEGQFQFALNKRPKSTNVNMSALEVLMEWTKAADEASKC